MKIKITISFISLICLFLAGCADDYQESFTFSGTVEELDAQEEILVIKEHNNINKGIRGGNVYVIPVVDVKRYNIGQNVVVTVFSNTDEDVWDVDHMKFDINIVKE
ncbi:hypothetical protein NSQ95_15725 [Psychrobacillus sp. FSL W7-1457]|uniref:hypothetical protein n=1 Tax=unclassified Psychrobacillus TaxID=2636677 RepID=UPI0030F8BBAF